MYSEDPLAVYFSAPSPSSPKTASAAAPIKSPAVFAIPPTTPNAPLASPPTADDTVSHKDMCNHILYYRIYSQKFYLDVTDYF